MVAHGPVLRTLYGSLLRTARSIEALTNKHNAHFVGQVLRRSTIKQFAEASLVSLVSKPFSAADGSSPASLVREAFRGRGRHLAATEARSTCPPSHSLDDAFAALRIGNDILSWLRLNGTLHRLHETDADVLEGACAIADALRGDGEHCLRGTLAEIERYATEAADSCVESLLEADSVARGEVEDLLEIADEVKTLLEADGARLAGDAAGRLRTLQRINTILYDKLGLKGHYGSGDFADISRGSGIDQALARRRGLPIALCVIYRAVASRLGLPVQVTNFPNHVLLRLETEGEGAVQTAEGSEAEAGAGVDVSAVTGLFVADYGPHGPEVVDVQVGRYWGEVRLVATKVTGDAHVPVRSASSLLLTFGEARGSDAAAPPLLFERCDPAGLWFVDAFRGGALLPPQVCAEILARTGMPPDQHAGCLEPAPPASVWARMTRNLWAAARRGGDETKAVFWEGAGCGLDEAAGRAN
ncbi:hypothetical protein EMIHUDRAFT_108529 [Emiliania huxleyi CCMP1516]|uniref:Protein SirB1 N-terminal domain-containing protein n=2 Tax=Emiliania huxleyi TaxID=2903 RepID=A0A0D3I2M4_EMIH1|nr:hypothetical protein EMIHUDRAFT_121482 [Emiliania huxleyi CCMP1516]XP_005792753.1 hypothetical protein EMIHUDRAFT_108529 [Emiliania huxleyi CCMP1516]EOD05509.1 hypothetical protein EMIHUDRAFT_121482 [Emiliania huxleyi CCMP1516]EOD40324.1 hypothetical protein EMIHUDRAFT_108529 [Emiliania huxleyi CCMP1516]|eukprot:XP_005757938.1 hypothetical protein EMIHUDRAFT_121482 [Emiliania huxleyi CCMP1516]